MPSVLVIGAGVSGLACALGLHERGVDFGVYEAEERVGGHAKTDHLGGFRFDHGPHVVLGIPPALAPLVADLDLGLRTRTCESTIYYGRFGALHVAAPLQRNLARFPARVRIRCLVSYLRAALLARPGRGATHRDALERTLGGAITDLFFEPYAAKRLCLALADVDAGWTERVAVPRLSEMLRSLWPQRAARPGFDCRFAYPERDGIERLPRAMASKLPPGSIHARAALVELDLHAKVASFSDGRRAHYDTLVSSAPLSALVAMVRDVPGTVRDAARHLVYASTYVVNLGTARPLSNARAIIRFPETELPFYRLSFPSRYAPETVPSGCDSVVAELGHHPERRPMTPAEALQRARAGLAALGLLGRDERTVVDQVLDVPVSHVIHGTSTPAALEHIEAWLARHDVYTCGKYGRWRELLMPASMLDGREVAERIAVRACAGRIDRHLALEPERTGRRTPC